MLTKMTPFIKWWKALNEDLCDLGLRPVPIGVAQGYFEIGYTPGHAARHIIDLVSSLVTTEA